MAQLTKVLAALGVIIGGIALLVRPPQLASHTELERNEWLIQLMEHAHIPGLAIVTVRNGQIDFMASFGAANIEQKTPLTHETLFNIASISKPLLGILLLDAEQKGILSLDENINKYLPFSIQNPYFPDDAITLRNIATHTSSIADYFNFDFYCFGQDCNITLEEYLFRLLAKNGDRYETGKHFLQHRPGEHWQYSNLATALAGYILERQSGKTLDELSSDLLFNKLLAAPASWKLNPVLNTPLATQYEVQGCVSHLICFDPQDPTPWKQKLSQFFNTRFSSVHYRAYPPFGNPQYPDGGIRTNIQGMGHLLVNLISNQDSNGFPLIETNIYQQMFKIQISADIQKGQRFFWRQNDGELMTDDYIGHIGADYGLFTALYFNPQTRDGFAVLMNRGIDDLSWQAMSTIASAYRQKAL
jgi:CubicO group peptidase (beta-lactamase class C family)